MRKLLKTSYLARNKLVPAWLKKRPLEFAQSRSNNVNSLSANYSKEYIDKVNVQHKKEYESKEISQSRTKSCQRVLSYLFDLEKFSFSFFLSKIFFFEKVQYCFMVWNDNRRSILPNFFLCKQIILLGFLLISLAIS